MKKIILTILLLFPSLANAESLRSTSFEERPICEKNHGVWREFGNICADNCEYKFDLYAVCSKATTFSCDCGPQKCWHNQKCISTQTYKTVFDKESAKEDKELAEKRKEREDKMKNDPNMRAYLSNIYGKKADANAAAQNNLVGTPGAAPSPGAPAGQPLVPSAQAQLPSAQSLIQQNQERGITQVPAQLTQSAPMLQAAQADRQEKVPPLFAKQEQAKKDATIIVNKPAGGTPAAAEETVKFPEIPVPR